MVDKVVNIKTGKAVISASKFTGEIRKKLNHDGKRWAKLKWLYEQGSFTMTTLSGELPFDEALIDILDSYIEKDEDDARVEKRKEKYLKSKKKSSENCPSEMDNSTK